MAVQTECVDQIAQVILEDGMMNLTPDALQIFRAAWRGHAHLYAKILKCGQMHLDVFEVSNNEASDFFWSGDTHEPGCFDHGLPSRCHTAPAGGGQRAKSPPHT